MSFMTSYFEIDFAWKFHFQCSNYIQKIYQLLKMTTKSFNFVGTDIIDSYFKIEGSNIGNFGN